MSKLAWKPWHKVVRLRDDLRTGELAMNLFAADLYDVVMGRARPVYGDPREFFALTYPTFNLRLRSRAAAAAVAGARLARPGRRGLGTLGVIGQTLMVAREKVGLDHAWRGKLVSFFQYLTQAATKVDHCAVVASLLATDPRRGDA